MLTALVTLFVAAVVGVVVLVAVLAILGMVFGVAFGLLALALKLVPILLVGWIVVKLVRAGERRAPRQRLSAADRRWLDS